jgi:hypothetical protein
MNNTYTPRSVRKPSLAETGQCLENIQRSGYEHKVKLVFWNENVLLYKNHIYDDVCVPKSLFQSLEKNWPEISFSERFSYESIYHVVLFAYKKSVFTNGDEAYEYGRGLLEEGERLRHWEQRFNCRAIVSAPVLHDKTESRMPSWLRSQGKRLKFRKRSQKMRPRLSWVIPNGVSGARTYPNNKKIDLKSKLFTESTGQITLEWREKANISDDPATTEGVSQWSGKLDASATTKDVLQCIYTAYNIILKQKGTSPVFEGLWRKEKSHYIILGSGYLF